MSLHFRLPPVVLAGSLCGESRVAAVLLSIEPDVFEARAVVDAVDHQRYALDPRLKADRGPGVKDNGSDTVFRQSPLDLPHQLPALLGVGLDRLAVDQAVELGVAVAAVIAFRAAD